MQSQNPLAIYFNERLDVLNEHLQNTHQNFNEYDLHQLRVEIKKMRTLLRLMNVLAQEGYNKKKYEKILRKLFKPGGKLREAQINIAQANEFNFALTNRYNDYLELKTKIHTEKFRIALSHFIVARYELFKKELEAFIEKTDDEEFKASVIKFLHIEFDTIKILYPKISNQNKLHKVRMHLKASGYVLNLAMTIWNDDSLQDLYNNIKSIETMIGDWHDKIVFKQSLQKFADQDLSPTEVYVLNSTADSVNEKISKSYTEISYHLEQLINDDIALFYKKYSN